MARGYTALSNEVLDKFSRHSRQELSPTAFMVYVYLLRHRNRRTNRCDPSELRLADETGLCDRTIRRAIAELKAVGIISVRSGKPGRGRNHYQFHFLECLK